MGGRAVGSVCCLVVRMFFFSSIDGKLRGVGLFGIIE